VTDPYAVLGVPRGADGPAIHSAYRRAVRRTHPDVGGTAAEFEAVQAAYEALRDRGGRPPPPPPPPRRPAPSGQRPPPSRQTPAPPTEDVRAMEDLLAESQRLENEARRLGGLPPRDFGDAEDEPQTGDSFTAILDDAGRQLRNAASTLTDELRRRVRRML
jgi:hypothetical protein